MLRLPQLSWLAVIAVVMLLGHYARDWGLAALGGGLFRLPGRLWSMGQRDADLVIHHHRRAAGCAGRAFSRHLGFQKPAGRGRNHPDPRPDADRAGIRLSRAGIVLVWLWTGVGDDRHDHLRHPTHGALRRACRLHQVPSEIVDFGHMAGCSRRQMLWKILIPSARPTLMVGVNQVIMLSLNMVIIASMIGAGGLGFDVLASLKRLQIGEGIEAGLAITLLAIALDRLSQAFARPATTAAQRQAAKRAAPAPSPRACAPNHRGDHTRRFAHTRHTKLSRGLTRHDRTVLERPRFLDQHKLLRPARCGEVLAAAKRLDPREAFHACPAVGCGRGAGRARRLPAWQMASCAYGRDPRICSWP